MMTDVGCSAVMHQTPPKTPKRETNEQAIEPNIDKIDKTS